VSKTIRLNDETYKALEELQQKRETFDAVVKRLIDVFVMLRDVSNTLGPHQFLGGNMDK